MKLRYNLNGTTYETKTGDKNVLVTETKDNNRNVVVIKALAPIEIASAEIVLKNKYNKNDLIFVNGYQSWTDTKEFTVKEHLNNIYKRPKKVVDMFAFDKYGDITFKKYRKNVLHGFDYSYIKGSNPLLIASNNAKNAYLIINHDLKNNELVLESDCKITLKKNQELVVFDYSLYTGDVNQAIEKHFNKTINADNIFGYTSWYNHYQNINEKIILDNLENIDSKFNLFQIDDGYEEFVGDWLKIDKNKFPNGFSEIVKKIQQKNLIPGIWLAPFVAEEKSDLFTNRKDLFAKDASGNFIKCGCNWSGFYVLDIYNEQAREYIKKSLLFFKNMGFKLFKLDFLYSVGLIECHNKTRAMITEDAYQLIVDTLGDDVSVLGCGAVLSNSADKFTYLRIGPDVSLIFDDVFYMRLFHRERISTKITLQNTIYRSFMSNKLFLNDPDVFLLRDDNIKLNKKQKEALATINALFGNVLMTSDNLSTYDDEKKKLLERVLYINRNAKDKKYERQGRYIAISYSLDGKQINLKYDTKRGIFND